MRIAIASDHRGRTAVAHVVERCTGHGHDIRDVSIPGDQSTDYPDSAYEVARAVASGDFDLGILICGTGIGMSIAANKIAGVRAAVVHDELTAQLARSHNDANVLCVSGDLLGNHKIDKIVEIFLSTPFEGGRHARRVEKIGALERGEIPSTSPAAGGC